MKKWNKMKSNIADEELKYKFMNGYNLFYQEDSDKITIIGMKKNLLFYLTSSCSSKDIPMVKTIKTGYELLAKAHPAYISLGWET